MISLPILYNKILEKSRFSLKKDEGYAKKTKT